jgi:hypothetical protein
MTHTLPDQKRTALVHIHGRVVDRLFCYQAALILSIMVLVGALGGCSADQRPGESASGKKEQTAAVSKEGKHALPGTASPHTHQRESMTGRAAVRETVDMSPSKRVGARRSSQQKPDTVDVDNLDHFATEVLPPGRPGEPGITQGEVDILSEAESDPGTIEVLPPERPGERGITQAEMDALPSSQPDPRTIEVLPPERPGERGITQAEMDALPSSQPDPRTIEVLPPERPGERGITQAEMDALGGPYEAVDEDILMLEEGEFGESPVT